jgi:hypothetical protein
MLLYRSEQEYLMRWTRYDFLYGISQPVDNTHDNFTKFQADLAERLTSDSTLTPGGRTLGLFYSGSFDSAFSFIQSDQMKGTALRKSYDNFVARTKQEYPSRGNISLLIGSWRPRNNLSLLGNHPEIGMQMGGEGKLWRFDGIISYRFLSAKNKFTVDSLGHLVSTDKFNSWLFGAEVGLKFLDKSTFSTDIFAGIGYDVIYSVTQSTDPEEYVSHGSLSINFGLRHRIFLDRRTGWYIGGIARYSMVDYNNPGGTDLSGNTLTISIVTGWSFHETLGQFLKKLNYKGNWRQ